MRDGERLGTARRVCPSCGAPLDLDGRSGPSDAVAAHPRLNAVERELVDLLLHGYRVSQIATRLDTSVPTVRKRVRRLLAKTGTRSQADLIDSYRVGSARSTTHRGTRGPEDPSRSLD
jgi:DNA-binding CsgD family transcriptional regulator